MLCFLCGEKIGRLQSWVDQQYCCADHRKQAQLASSQAVRDEEDDQELWTVSKSRIKATHSTAPTGEAAFIFGFLTLGALAMAGMAMRGLSPIKFPEISSTTLHDDFHTGWSGWSSESMHNSGLRILSRSTALKNYQMEFSGQIEKKSLGWVFRATDEKNYYATKLLMTKPGPTSNAALVRYLMMNGREWDRVQTPLPLTLERGVAYRVRLIVLDDRFLTYLNGQLISSWTDKRLVRGGVGFFDDRQDPQQVAWVSISERDSILSRVLAHFSLIVIPSARSIK